VRLRLGGSLFGASLGKQFKRPSSKMTRTKWTKGVAEVADHVIFTSVKEALSSNSSPTKKEKKLKVTVESKNIKCLVND
jgi:hypothetical protein